MTDNGVGLVLVGGGAPLRNTTYQCVPSAPCEVRCLSDWKGAAGGNTAELEIPLTSHYKGGSSFSNGINV